MIASFMDSELESHRKEMDITTGVVPSTTTTSDFYLGLCLAVSSSLFIGSSFIIKKLSLIRLKTKGHVRAGSGGFGYLMDWMWWLGLLTMGLGELANFTAYAFAPASLVTPLGALSVLVNAILASKFLKEKLNNLGKLGCFLCLLGSTMIVIHSPKEEQIDNLQELLEKATNTVFIRYVLTIVIVCSIIFCYIGPHYGSRYVAVYLILCAAIGSLTVMSCKGLGLVIRTISVSSIHGLPNLWVPISLCLTVIVCICIQITYLNKALDLFSTSRVTPIYYVLFTTLVIIASSILFEEWRKMKEVDILGASCGFFVTVVAIFMLNDCKEGPVIPFQMRQNPTKHNKYGLVRSG
ncbi:unnamed protein product [Phaedon cochleariae]|uniref:Magnesium transporter NIPA2 n=1 Tax=Phaedon cochleariae TaxID=80249 RepID=A0A9N9SFR4_PHACE|nr:unnamed protein product [Phaedon cochleariae]